MTVFPLRRVAPGVRYDFAFPEGGCFGDRGLVAESPRGVASWNIYGDVLPERGCPVEHIRLCSPRKGLSRSIPKACFSLLRVAPETVAWHNFPHKVGCPKTS